ncbi:general secretion pathway protein GspB [Pseudidiomarina salilacus]|uniref:general secretion pathway protein GspB n=1 Tax=Pseudidiomarina salilacus TaxID=3384452 RepID=UPI003984CA71
MSSVLKALRQQQSKFIPQQQAIELAPAYQRIAPVTRWMPWLAVPVAALLGWFAVGWFMAPAALMEAQPQTISAPTWRLGEPTRIRQVELPTTTSTEVAKVNTDRPLPSSTPEPEASPVNDRGVDLEQVPADLLAAFDQAVAETGGGTEAFAEDSIVPQLSALSQQLQRQIPSFSYDAHQYSSRADSRFVSLAGQRLWQGDQWQGIQVLTIAPNHVVLAYGNTAFRQPALQDWTRP